MSLAAALSREAAPVQRGGRCSVALLLETLSADDAAELRSALASPMEHAAIARALTSEGHRFASSTIARHRRGECRCDAH